MTSTPSAGIQRPPLRPSTSNISEPVSRTVAQTFQEPPRSVPQQVLIDLSHASSLQQGLLVPTFKKQKLEISQNAVDHNPLTRHALHGYPAGASVQLSELHSVERTIGSQSVHGFVSFSVPFPTRGDKVMFSKDKENREKTKIAGKEEVQAKPYSLEVPKIAPRYRKDGQGDFFPWTGNHPEDILNDQTTRNGYFDKVQVSQSEMNTARQSLWSHLKHKSSLESLSSLFISAFDQRQSCGIVKSKCTFKPPPRVTLTDTKREAWLRDLADATIPLRRLSRTIPHGIRGKALLDHCLIKKIPTWRAVWLAKCVGANEIRAFKRKGNNGAFASGGEAKWIKDWTSNVEQFIETLIESCGISEWRLKITYGLQLVTHIYSEHLLDHEQYLEWLIKSFQESDKDHLPVWLLMIQIYWSDISRYRRSGRCVAEAMLEQLYKVSTRTTESMYRPLLNGITQLLLDLAMSAPDCLLLPTTWTKYESVFKTCFREEHELHNSVFQQIQYRNHRVARNSSLSYSEPERTSRQKVIAILDSLSVTYDHGALSYKCLESLSDRDLLVSTVVEWSTSRYRPGTARLYVAARLLRGWRKSGIELDRPIVAFLSRSNATEGIEYSKFYKLIAELIRSRDFSVGKYLQWLIAGGFPDIKDEANFGDSAELRLLRNIPLHGLPTHVLNLRQIILDPRGINMIKDSKITDSVKAGVAEQVDMLKGHDLPFAKPDSTYNLWELSGTSKYEISRWIRQRMVAVCHSGTVKEPPGFEGEALSPPASLEEFQALRRLLEQCEDYAVLADVVKLLSNCNDKRLLSALAETTNYHADIFRSMGALDGLFRALLSSLEVTHKRSPTDEPILTSLIDIGDRLHDAQRLTRKLRKEVLLCERKSAFTAYSPMSDHTSDAVQPADSVFSDEMEALLGSGTIMDTRMLSRVFYMLTGRLEKMWSGEIISLLGSVSFLARLRSFDMESFDVLMFDWLEPRLHKAKRSNVSDALAPLVCSQTIDLCKVFEKCLLRLKEKNNEDMYAQLAVDFLNILIYQHDVAYIERSYRYVEAKRRIVKECPKLVVDLIRSALSICVHEKTGIRDCTAELLSSFEFQQTLQEILINYDPAIVELRDALCASSRIGKIIQIFERMLGLSLSGDSQSPDIESAVANVLEVVNDFNIKLCILGLGALLYATNRLEAETEIILDRVINMIIRKVASSFQFRPAIWTSLLSSLPQEYVQLYHDKATTTLLATISVVDEGSIKVEDGENLDDDERENLLLSISHIEASTTSCGSSEFISEILQKLKSFQSLPLLKVQDHTPSTEDSHLLHGKENHQQRNGVFSKLRILLRLIAAHQKALQHPKVAQPSLCQLAISLSLLLVHPNLISNASLSSHLFDTVALVSDSLLSESRSHCGYVLFDQHCISDHRIFYLLGSSERGQAETFHLTSTTTPLSSSLLDPNPDLNGRSGSSVKSLTFPLRRWEMVQDATPGLGENDTSLSLSLFGARKAVM